MNEALAILCEINMYASEIGDQAEILSRRNLARDDRSFRVQAYGVQDHARKWRQNMTHIAKLLDQLEELI